MIDGTHFLPKDNATTPRDVCIEGRERPTALALGIFRSVINRIATRNLYAIYLQIRT
jgi:hypothetical protein